MEFPHNLNQIFMSSIPKINNTLLPSDFSGARRYSSDVAAKVGDIIDEMGIASAKAQELHRPITTAKKLRDSDHTIYLMIDPADNNGKGSVVGLLKIGLKNLFLSDETGKTHEIKSLCVLDFYVHESKQRAGFGKQLYDHMLNDNQIEPCKYAFDKPTISLLRFLQKHYGLAQIHPQNNNFVLFEGFFEKKKKTDDDESSEHPSNIKPSSRNGLDQSVQSDKYLPLAYGRHTAYKLPDTMAGIMWQDSPEKVATNTQHRSQDADSIPVPIANSEECAQNGRHTAFKLPDTMNEILWQSSTGADLTPISNSEEHPLNMSIGRHTAFKLPDSMGEIVENYSTRNDSSQIQDSLESQ